MQKISLVQSLGNIPRNRDPLPWRIAALDLNHLHLHFGKRCDRMCGNLHICYAVFEGRKDRIREETALEIAIDNSLQISKIMTNSPKTTMTIEDRIEQARADAHQAGEKHGKTSAEYIVAMDTLEELHQEAGHRSAAKPKNSLELYCSDNPEASECLIYDN